MSDLIETWKNDFRAFVNSLNLSRDDYKTMMEYIDEIPAVQPATNCSEIPNSSTDCISRQAAIDALAKQMPKSYTSDGSHPADEEIFRAQEVFADCIEALEILPSAQPEKQHGRIFQEIVVIYPSYNPHPERKGKPYFLIKYTENGQEFIGYGTYKPEVLSEYLKEYFMPSEQPEIIHCGDCKYYGRADKRRFYRGMDCLQKRIDTIVPDKDFCSRAERRTDGQG